MFFRIIPYKKEWSISNYLDQITRNNGLKIYSIMCLELIKKIYQLNYINDSLFYFYSLKIDYLYL